MYRHKKYTTMTDVPISSFEEIENVVCAICKKKIIVNDADWLYDEELGWVHESCIYLPPSEESDS